MKFFYHSKQGDIIQLNSSRRVSIILKSVTYNFYARFVGVAGTSHERAPKVSPPFETPSLIMQLIH